jgi:Bardet-Biedl syndrome 2 protein
MSRHYAELFKLNNQLIGEYVKRSNNHQALLEALKEVNHTIQKAANLRMGQAKTKVRCPTDKA